MKINELERNLVTQDQGSSPTIKSGYKYELPIIIGDYDVRYKKARVKGGISIRVSVWNGNKGVAELWLDPFDFRGLRVYQVSWAGLDPKYKGQGIGYQLYKGLISIIGLDIIQTTSHSIGARKTWLRLANDPKIVAYGFDWAKEIVFKVQPNKNKTELKSARGGIMLYDNNTTGLVLVKRNSKDDKFLAGLEAASLYKRDQKGPDVFGIKKFKPI
jgi:hypothetical protein